MFIFVGLISFLVYAVEPLEMNGIKVNDYKDFDKKWTPVTVRFREDSKEERFVFANDLAYAVLKEHRIDYPDGAVLAKIGAKTEVDPLFASSRIPTTIQRIQFMVRDKKKYASTNGWGYAIFEENGKPMGDDPKNLPPVCFACHQLAASRGDVFSIPVTWRATGAFKPLNPLNPSLKFVEKKSSELPRGMAKLIPAEFKVVDCVDSKTSITKNIFSGTLNEMKPQLLLIASQRHRPACLISFDQKYFSLIVPIKNGLGEVRCGDDNQAFFSYVLAPPFQGQPEPTIPKQIVHCQPI